MKALILQVLGALKGYKLAKFVIDGERVEGEHKLVGSALLQRYSDSTLVLLAPESLAVTHARDIEELKEMLKQEGRFIDSIREHLTEEGISAEIRPMQSVGDYMNLSFKNHMDNMVAHLLKELVQLVSTEKYQEVIFVTSTGLNIYVTALLEVARILLAYLKLRGVTAKDYKIPQFEVCTHAPIMGEQLAEVPVYTYPFDVRAFFDFPFRKGPGDFKPQSLLKETSLQESVYRRLGERRELNAAIHQAYRAFNAVRFNVPLAFFDNRLVELDKDPGELLRGLLGLLDYIEQELKNVELFEGAKVVVSRPKLNRAMFANALLTLALYASLKEFRNGLRDVKPTIEVLRSTFGELYERLGLPLNWRFLDRDLRTIEQIGSAIPEGEEKLLEELTQRRALSESFFQDDL